MTATDLEPRRSAGTRPEVRRAIADLAEIEGRTDTVRTYRPERKINSTVIMGIRLLVLVALIAGWEIAARAGIIDPFFYSMPSQIWETGVSAFTDGTIVADTLFTFTSTIVGFLLGTAGGVAIGLSFWWSRRYALVAEPFVVAFEAMPKLALAPIVVLILGLGMSSKIAMACALVIVIQALNTYSGVKSVDKDLTRMIMSLGATRRQIFTKVVVPTTLPWIISGLRVTIGLALAGAIVGEYIGSTQGVGRLIQYAGTTYEISLIWVGIFVLAALSMVLYALVGFIERRWLASLHATR